jgi:hypothetical protein
MEAREKVRKHLYRHIGHLVTAGRAVFDQKRRCWRVPVLAKTDRGIFPIGEFELDEDLNFVIAPTKAEMMAVLRSQLGHTLTLVLESPEEVAKRGLTPVAI